MTPVKLAELDEQLKSYEKKLDNYEKQYLKTFQEEGVPKDYRDYLLQTITWLRRKIDMLIGIKVGSLHQEFLHNELYVGQRHQEAVPAQDVCEDTVFEDLDDGEESLEQK